MLFKEIGIPIKVINTFPSSESIISLTTFLNNQKINNQTEIIKKSNST